MPCIASLFPTLAALAGSATIRRCLLFFLPALPTAAWLITQWSQLGWAVRLAALAVCVCAAAMGRFWWMGWLQIAVVCLALVCRLTLLDVAALPALVAVAAFVWRDIRLGIGAGLGIIAVKALTDWAYDGSVDSESLWSLALQLCVAILLALSWRMQVEHERHRRQELALQQQARDMRTAARLHDAVCNDLVYATYLAEQRNGGADDELEETLRGALGKVRAIIRGLDRDINGTARVDDSTDMDSAEDMLVTGTFGDRPTHDAVSKAAREQLVALCAQSDARLAAVGLTGASLVGQLSDLTLDEKTLALAKDCVEELSGNIMKHGNRSYGLSVETDGDDLVVTATNGLRATGPDIPTVLDSGLDSGLKRLTQRIEAAGGTITAGKTDTTWTTVARIPSVKDAPCYRATSSASSRVKARA